MVAALGPSADNHKWNTYLNTLPSNSAKQTAETLLHTRKRIAQSILKDVFGQHVVDLVWFHIDHGPNPRGCFGSTPVDPMHAFEEGIVPNVLSVILDPLSDSAKSQLDSLAMNIVSTNRWDGDYPRMNFTGGFSSLTQLTADEKVGKLCLLWILMQTPIGLDILTKRCSPTFDSQKALSAFRFTGKQSVENDESESDYDNSSCESVNALKFVGTPSQVASVDKILQDYKLHYVIPWINQMSSFHRNILRKSVYELIRGKVQRNCVLPVGDLMDRYEVNSDISQLYCNVVVDNSGEEILSTDDKEALYSIDGSVDELQNLLEMMLAFHAAYKYGRVDEQNKAFDQRIRQMMAMIKSIVKRGNDTKNWSISKFHELLHLPLDSNNYGSLANIDASKGENGLKLWAKLPSKTVRHREASLYNMKYMKLRNEFKTSHIHKHQHHW